MAANCLWLIANTCSITVPETKSAWKSVYASVQKFFQQKQPTMMCALFVWSHFFLGFWIRIRVTKLRCCVLDRRALVWPPFSLYYCYLNKSRLCETVTQARPTPSTERWITSLVDWLAKAFDSFSMKYMAKNATICWTTEAWFTFGRTRRKVATISCHRASPFIVKLH